MNGRRFWVALSGNWVGELMIRGPQVAMDLLIIQLLSPAQLGVWIGVKAAMQFASSLSGVPLAGLDIEYSYAVGAAKEEVAKRAAGAAAYAVVLLTLLTMIALSPALFITPLRATVVQGASPWEFAILLGFVACQGAYNFFLTHLRNQLRFAHVNAVSLLGSLLTVACVYALAPAWGVPGVVIGYIVAYTFCVAVWSRWLEVRLPAPSETKGWIRSLCMTGAALAAVTVAVSALRLITRWFIGQQFGEESLGHYGVAATAAGAVLLAGAATSRVVMQFAARAVGANLPAEQRTVHFALLPGVAIAGAGAVASLGVAGFAEWLIPLWAPQHASALALLRPVLYAAIVLGVAMVLTSALRAQSRQRPLLAACLGASCLQVLLMVAAVWRHWSLFGFACLEGVSFSVFLLALLAIAPCSKGQRVRFGVAVCSAVLACMLAMELSRAVITPVGLESTLLNVMLATFVFAPWLPFAGWFCRGMTGRLSDATSKDSPSRVVASAEGVERLATGPLSRAV